MAHYPNNAGDDAAGSPPPLPLDTAAPMAADPYAPQPPVKNDGVAIWVLAVVALVTGLICLMIGCAVGFVMGAAVTALEDFEAYTPLDNITLTVEAPESVETGEAFAVVVTIDNKSTAARTISTIDLYDTYLAGVTLESASPAWTEKIREDNYTMFSFPQTIQPGSSLTIKLNFVAGDKPGTYADDLEVWFVDADEYLYETLETTIE